MGTISKANKLKISIHSEKGGKHKTPHVHIEQVGQYEASVSIADQVILAGNLPAGIKTTFLAWVKANSEELMNYWNETNADNPNLKPIANRIPNFKP